MAEEKRMGEEEVERRRIYVGGIGERITSEDLNNIFSSLGKVESVEIIRTKSRSFAYLDFSPSHQNSLSKLFSKYNGCVWKGGRLRLEKAKEHYLDRLKREWSQDAQLSATPLPTPPKHTPASSNDKNSKINIFFPRLCKVKSLPLSGTGKHKYSFQRVEAPPLPTYFCDCEEHLATSLGTAREKETHGLEQDVGGVMDQQEKETHDLEEDYGGVTLIDEQELQIMNSVMNRLFQRESISSAAQSGETGLASENEAEQDNLVTNVVLRGNNGMALSRCQQDTTISRKRRISLVGETQSSKGRPTQNDQEVQKMKISPPTKKRKSLINEASIKNESMSTKPVGDVNMQMRPNKLMKKASVELQSGVKQSNTSHSWSQKLSWRKLVGDKNSSVFSVSNILPAFTPTKEVDNALESIEDMQFDENEVDEDDLIVNVVSKKNNRLALSRSQALETFSIANQRTTFNETETSKDVPKRQKKNTAPTKKRKSLLNGESDIKESVFASPEVDGSLQTDTNESGMPKVAQPVEPEELHVKQSITDCSSSQKSLCVGDKDNDAFNVSNKLLSVSTNEGQPTSDGPDVADATDRQNRSLVRNENLEGKSDEKKLVELPAEAQPINNNASNKSGRGSSWYQKSSWTQLVNENNNSFSITQISPSITFESHEATTPYGSKDAQNLNNSKLNNLVKQHAKEGTRDGSTALEGKKAGDVAKNFSEKNKQTVLGNSETSAVSVENQNDPIQRQTSYGEVRIGETCSFMRSAASIKEWAKTKAALSGSDKKKGSKGKDI